MTTKHLYQETSTKNWIILHDNAPIHTCRVVVDAIRETNWSVMLHPAYSLDLASSDFALFTSLKSHFRGNHFDDEESLKKSVTEYLNSLGNDFFINALSLMDFMMKNVL